MKRITNFLFLTFSVLLYGQIIAQGQTRLGNEWIHYGQAHFKIKIGAEGVYKITANTLSSLGLSNVPGNQFVVFRDGREVPIYTSTNGTFSNSDYIQFYAYPATGAVHSDLYPNAPLQPDTFTNLFTDSATYFLSFNNSLPHQRLVLKNNSIPSNPPAAAPYCWVDARPQENPKTYWAPGKSYDVSEYFYSSDFDHSEGYSYVPRTTVYTFLHYPTPQLYTGSSASPQLSFVLGSNINQTNVAHAFNIRIGSTDVFDTTFSGYVYVRKKLALAKTFIGNTETTIRFGDPKRYAIYSTVISYPRSFDFQGNFSQQANFRLPSGQRYLSISQFNAGNERPLLFDLEKGKIYSGTNSGGLVNFYLDNDMGERSFFLTNQQQIHSLTNWESVQFRDYTVTSNEGDYLILTHKDFINASPNYVQEYSDYRKSQTGGAYQTVIIDVTELYDQFGYGYWGDPMSIRRFLKFAYNTWTTTPKYLLILGKGVTYNNYDSYNRQRQTYTYPMVPTWGHPGSDNLLSSFDHSQKPELGTGRISVYTNQEIGDYLVKVQAYDAAIKSSTVPSVASDLWKKKALHLAGATDLNLQAHLKGALNDAANIYRDTLIGGQVTTMSKNTTDPIENIDDPLLDTLINNGLNLITFYGHASAAGFDYNLNEPDFYHSNPRFPIFIALGCDVSQIFTLTNQKTVSENYIHSQNGGAIAMLAEDNFGYTNILPGYMKNIYETFSHTHYGSPFGWQVKENTRYLQSNFSGNFMTIHNQCMIYQGDPAIHVYNPEKPDYAVESGSISTNPGNISTQLDSFELKATIYNLGKAISDTLTVVMEHTRVGNSQVIQSDTMKVPQLYFSDTLKWTIPIDPIHDLGINNYTIKLDPENKFEELSKQNNEATLQIFIYANSLKPIYPYDFAIVHEQGIELKASTLNAFSPIMPYKLQIDTSMNFDSPLLQETRVVSIGGIIRWRPNLSYQDSVVYYWRGAVDSLVNGQLQWGNSSFIYLANGSDGWNQSHYYQYVNNAMSALAIPENTRKFTLAPITNRLIMENKVIYPPTNDYANVRQTLNDVLLDQWGCIATGSIRIMIIDKNSGIPWANSLTGLYGSAGLCSSDQSRFMFEFPTNTLAGRDSARRLIERVPEGDYIMIANSIYGGPPGPSWDKMTATKWQADTNILGSGRSLYHSIKALGFNGIDQFDRKKAFILFRKKADNSYPVYERFAMDSTSKLTLITTFVSNRDSGSMTTPVIGPAQEWTRLIWKTSATDHLPANDKSELSILGINNGSEQLLYKGPARDTSLSFINADSFPNLRLKWSTMDTITRTSAQLDFWRILYKPVPEAALNAAVKLEFTDSLSQGQKQNIVLAIENISDYPMDSLLVKYRLIDAQNRSHELSEKRYKPLPARDTLQASLSFLADAYPGKNFLFIEANPDGDQPEQYHLNNVGYLPFTLHSDKNHPLLDVTFDGIHILDKDLVSAKPLINISLRDENRFAPLNDTSLMTVKILKPQHAAAEAVPIDGEICRFIPAEITDGKDNKARIEYRPHLKEDGVYKLIVSGKDKAGNRAGNAPTYEVQFTVENKPSITNVLNYPNPFSTATQFLFTLTGSQIPSQFKIQILTVSGKVVREITKAELGPIHIGRNLTEYRWDGRDQYGQLLGNGVYLYRVVTSLEGEEIEHRSNAKVDQFFKQGYGKMYLMR